MTESNLDYGNNLNLIYIPRFARARRDLVEPHSILRFQTEKFTSLYFVALVEKDIVRCLMLESSSGDKYGIPWSTWGIKNCQKHLEMYHSDKNHALPIVVNFFFDSAIDVLFSGSTPLEVFTNKPSKLLPLKERNVSKKTLKTCSFCHSGKVDNFFGVLSYCYGKDWRKSFWAHEHCLKYSSRPTSKTTDEELLRLSSTDEYIRPCSSHRCNNMRPTLGCFISDSPTKKQPLSCQTVYHFRCALEEGAEWCTEKQAIYCKTHLPLAIYEHVRNCGFPNDKKVSYTLTNDWSRISEKHQRIIRENSREWHQHTPEWFNMMISTAIEVREITDKKHWAFCPRMASNGERQYEAISSRSVTAGELMCEYSGVVRYHDKSVIDEKDNYYLARLICSDDLKGLDVPALVVDARHSGNESRYINSVSDTTPPNVVENCVMSIVWARGSLRIFIIAKKDLKKGEVLVLNYGNEFFQEEEKNNDADDNKNIANSLFNDETLTQNKKRKIKQ